MHRDKHTHTKETGRFVRAFTCLIIFFFTLTGGYGWSGVLESFALFQCNRFMYLHFFLFRLASWSFPFIQYLCDYSL